MFEVLKDIMREEIDAEKATAKADGEKIGFSNGEKVGFSNGEKVGFSNGEKVGFTNGEKVGLSNGEKVGFSNGEKAGARTMLYDLVHDKVISLEEGASRAGMDETLFMENMNKLYSCEK